MSTNITKKSLWNAVLSQMQLNLSELNYKTWFEKTSISSLENNTLKVECPNNAIKTKLETLYKPMIQESVNKIGKEKYEILFNVGTEKQKNKTGEFLDKPLFQNLKNESEKKAYLESNLNQNYTFDNYVMGDSNRLAYAIATTIGDNPGVRHNPFFLYSGVGQGKTHLIHAIGNRIIKKHKKKRVLYTTSENFTNELIEAIRAKGNRTEHFRKRYRNVDVLIIDDIQFIAGKNSTQEEFFHTFNDLFMNQKQIVLASDRPPEAFTNIEARLISRFKSGIMADIQTPEYELRTAILRSKRDVEGETVSNEVIDFIAENISTNIRELEAAYFQVVTYVKATGKEFGLESAKEALSGLIQTSVRDKPLNANSIIKAVCNYYSVKTTDIKGKRRNKEVVIPRQIAMFLLYDMTQTPYMSIGELLGGRDHTTVMHGVRKIENEMKNNMRTKQDLVNIRNFINQN